MTENEPIPPFGTYRLTAREAAVIRLTRSMPQGWVGKRMALLFRKLAKSAMRRPVDIEVFGRPMRLNGLKNIAERRLLIQPQHFDPNERAALANHLKPGDFAIDIGANVGAYTLFMAGLVGAKGLMIAVEPQPSVLARLMANLALNPDLSVEIVAKALGAEEGETQFELSDDNEGQSRIASSGQGVKVPITTLKSVVLSARRRPLAALKIDVEGAEPSVLQPFFDQADRADWPKLMIMERNDSRWPIDLIGYLRAKGYVDRIASKMNTLLHLA